MLSLHAVVRHSAMCSPEAKQGLLHTSACHVPGIQQLKRISSCKNPLTNTQEGRLLVTAPQCQGWTHSTVVPQWYPCMPCLLRAGCFAL